MTKKLTLMGSESNGNAMKKMNKLKKPIKFHKA